MECNGCGSKEATRWRKYEDGSEQCDHCGVKVQGVPDVFFDKPYFDPHLIDLNTATNKEQIKGTWIESKRQKKELMSRLGVHEAGDRQHGSRAPYRPMKGGWDNV